jgi:hypothetical protein
MLLNAQFYVPQAHVKFIERNKGEPRKIIATVPNDPHRRMSIRGPHISVELDTFDEVAGETSHIANLARKSSLTLFIANAAVGCFHLC